MAKAKARPKVKDFVRVGIDLPREFHQRLTEFCERRGATMTGTMKIALEALMASEGK